MFENLFSGTSVSRMDSISLQSCVEYLAQGSADVYTVASDFLFKVKISTRTIIVIANTDKSTGKGEHWIAFYTYISPEGTILTDYYDSFAKKLDYYGLKYPYPITKSNTLVHQNNYSSLCGHLTLYFIHLRLRRYPYSHAIETLTTDKDKNERVAVRFYNKIIAAAGRNIQPHFACGNYGCLPKHEVLANHEDRRKKAYSN